MEKVKEVVQKKPRRVRQARKNSIDVGSKSVLEFPFNDKVVEVVDDKVEDVVVEDVVVDVVEDVVVDVVVEDVVVDVVVEDVVVEDERVDRRNTRVFNKVMKDEITQLLDIDLKKEIIDLETFQQLVEKLEGRIEDDSILYKYRRRCYNLRARLKKKTLVE